MQTGFVKYSSADSDEYNIWSLWYDMDPAGYRTDYASGYVWHVYVDVEGIKTEWVKEEIPDTYNFWLKAEKRIETSAGVPIRL